MSDIRLTGKTILVTRPEPECHDTANLIAHHGGIPLLAPVMTIAPPLDPTPLTTALHQLNRYQGVILTSVNGARAFLQFLPAHQPPPPLYAVGEKTAQCLRQAGFSPLVPANPSDSRALAQVLPREDQRSYLLIRAQEGRDELLTLAQQEGFQLDWVVGYRAVAVEKLPLEVVAAWNQQKVDAITFFSARTATLFMQLFQQANLDHHWPLVVVNSEQTAAPLLAAGIPVAAVACQPTVAMVLSALSSVLNP
ncbi:MAG: uroporphyrinogen-III synthase [Magnetococcales bacterium]|nr:uroporphyrinogen-III synthase [Magnetococcales bacterium]NGZ25270.1 uroporphyrinogen-III synthase [Magnetococcales bacterium]